MFKIVEFDRYKSNTPDHKTAYTEDKSLFLDSDKDYKMVINEELEKYDDLPCLK